ncbi:MAG: V-type ATP synthase subunit D [Clostridiales bacterium]|nr:V-type ATP synthase subunit D [Clostridiales bacterium]
MAEQIFPTKGSLIKVKRSLHQAKLGYELMDRKRNILIREMVLLLDKAKKLRGSIEDTYETAYKALQRINITLGVTEPLGNAIPIENGLEISYRSVMGVELPIITLETTSKSELSYGLAQTNSYFDYAYKCFNKVKELTVILAEVENCIYRLAIAIKKTQKRANALKNILIPKFEEQEKYITNSLEEKEREEFFREKVIKRQKLKKAKKIS